MFEPGTQVICINDQFPASVARYLRNLPRKGSAYTVRDIIPAQGWDEKETCAVLLVELVNTPPPHRPEWGECGFSPNRFREIEPETATEYHETTGTLTL